MCLAILEDAGADILIEALDTLGCEYRVEPQRPARSLRWSRVKPDPCPHGVPPEVWAADEQDLLLLLEPEEFLQGVIQLTQVLGEGSHQPSTRETRLPESSATACAQVVVGWPEVEEALVLLQLWANMDVLLVASWQELSQHVCTFTKALAQRPFKCVSLTLLVAAARRGGGRWAAGERVAGDGTGLRAAWWRQIQQFNRVSPAVADAVVTAFPSPRLLQQAYVACGSEQERLALLTDLPVKMGEGVRPRRVGPDLSRRICLFLTTDNPDLLLDLGS
ncbi:putative crossover junction endonuclease EME2 [Camelus ferus]|nr:putative crossover junction endonuclease EME2 [Camelus ferus]